jgi:hypothetical protein
MTAVLTLASTLQCVHLGPVTVIPTQERLKVDGKEVVIRVDLIGAAIACPFAANPCGTVATIDSGLSTTLKVGTEAVVLATASGTTATGAAWQVVSAGQTKLEAT